jgi:hypothetical protein
MNGLARIHELPAIKCLKEATNHYPITQAE